MERQLLAVFVFGRTFSLGQEKNLSPPEVHALAITCLMDVFKYADHQAIAFAEQLIAASSDRNVHPTIRQFVVPPLGGTSSTA